MLSLSVVHLWAGNECGRGQVHITPIVGLAVFVIGYTYKPSLFMVINTEASIVVLATCS